MENKALYTLPKFFDASETFVYYSFRHPVSGKMQRVRVYDGFGGLHGAQKKKHAEALIAEWTDKLKDGFDPFAEAGKKQVTDTNSIYYYLDEALKQKKRWNKNSKKSYNNAVRLFKKWLVSVRKHTELVSRITEDDAADYLDWLEVTEGVSPTTRNNHRGFMGTIFNAIRKILRAKKISIDNVFLLTKKVTEDRRGRTPFNPQQVERIRKYLIGRDPRLWLACLFVRYTMVRTTEELPRLKLSDIDTEKMKLTVRGEISKNHRTQTVHLHPDILELMNALGYFEYPLHYYIFGKDRMPAEVEMSKNNITKRFSRVREALKFSSDYSLYSFKHTGNAELHARRIPLPKIRDQNRHSDIRTTDIYSRQYSFYNEENVWAKQP